MWIPSTLEWIHTQIASQTSELRCKNSFKKSHFLITMSPQKNFLSYVILSCSRTDLVKYMDWLKMNSYHIGMNSFLIWMVSFSSRKQVCKNALYYTVLCCIIPHHTIQCFTVLYCTVLNYILLLDHFEYILTYLISTGCPKKNWTLGFLLFIFFPVTFEHFWRHLNIIGGSFSKIKTCQVILKLFHLFLPNFDP